MAGGFSAPQVVGVLHRLGSVAIVPGFTRVPVLGVLYRLGSVVSGAGADWSWLPFYRRRHRYKRMR